MKTCALYGFISALSGAFLILILFFTGFHSDPAKLTAATWIGGVCGLGIGITCMVLGVKARRAEVPASEGFGYGRAFGTGLMISVFSSLLSAIFTYAYYSFINPAFLDILLQDSFNKLEARGMSGDRLDKTEAFNRIIFTPVWQAVIALIFGVIFGLIIALIVAAVLKRPAPNQAKA